MLVKQGTIQHKQAVCIIMHFSRSTAAPSCDTISAPHEATKEADLVGAEASSPSAPTPERLRLLCAGILARLAALRERIQASGRAVLRPSNAIMGRPFVPALDFLRRVVSDVAAPAAHAEEAAAARKRPRSDEGIA
jgi:hypothetical protein